MAAIGLNTFQSASLYVGDLIPDVTEGLLFELFNRVGPVASIRVCRDTVTRRSLGYSYVNFHNFQDAERALDTMNFNEIKGKPCRIMWSQRDPSIRRSAVGNIFIKNLANTVDNKGLYDTFSVFGNILSCKVATNESGESKGYGYVHYETAESAEDAISKFNGNYIEELPVTVTHFQPANRRATPNSWTNVYVKQFPESWTQEKLNEVFGQIGTIQNAHLVVDNEGKSKCFGYVNFQSHEDAEKAVQQLHDNVIEEGYTLYVARFQKKVEHLKLKAHQAHQFNSERVLKFQGLNLYIKNLDDTISDEVFKNYFSPFGTITSARIMRNPEDGSSKGFGFVCYSAAEEATRALTELQGKMLGSKPITVAIHQSKDIRQQYLQSNRQRNMGYGQQAHQIPYGAQGGGYYFQGQGGFPPRRNDAYTAPYAGQIPYQPRTANPRGMPYAGRGPPANGFYPMPVYQQQYPGYPMQQQQRAPRGGMQQNVSVPNVQGGRGQPRNVQGQNRINPNRQAQVNTQGSPNRPQGRGVQYNSQVRNPQGAQTANANPPTAATATDISQPLDDQMLAQADPASQKNIIGERLFPLIHAHQPELAGKITGMLLEMDNAELLNLIESPDALMGKIDEALHVLKQHGIA